MLKRSLIFTFIVGLMLCFVAYSEAGESIEYKLASINAGYQVPKNHITVARFRSLLNQLSSTYTESKPQIADMSVKAHSMLTDNGVEESLLDIMEGLNQLFTRKIDNQKYAEYAAAYVTLRTKGYSHTQTISSLQALLESMGAE